MDTTEKAHGSGMTQWDVREEEELSQFPYEPEAEEGEREKMLVQWSENEDVKKIMTHTNSEYPFITCITNPHSNELIGLCSSQLLNSYCK